MDLKNLIQILSFYQEKLGDSIVMIDGIKNINPIPIDGVGFIAKEDIKEHIGDEKFKDFPENHNLIFILGK